MALSAVLLKPNVANILLFYFCEQKFVQHASIMIAIENGQIMPLNLNPHQIVADFGCVDFSMYACWFSVARMRQFCLFTYPPRSKGASSEKLIFLPKHYHDFQSNVAIFLNVVRAYTQPYSFGGRIKLIICQIRHELTVALHEISTSWKNVRWRTLYIKLYLT